MDRKKKKQYSSSSANNKDLLRYAGLATQLLVTIGLAVFAGLKLDQWLKTLPLFSSALPLLVLGATFYKLFRDTNREKKDSD